MRPRSFGGPSAFQRIGGQSGGGNVSRIIVDVANNTSTTAASTGTLTAPIAGIYRLALVGPGGGGGGSIGGGKPGGGGSGGVSVSKAFAMTAGQTQSVTLAARGAGGTRPGNSTGIVTAANGGGPTTATLPDGSVLTAGPGSGGGSGGGAGGSADGGEFNFPGNAGGSGPGSGGGGEGVRDSYTIAGQTIVAPFGSTGAYSSTYGNGAGGGGSTPTAKGLIPPAPGQNGTAISGGAPSPALDPRFGYAGQGGGAVSVGSTTSNVSGQPGGPATAYLILEVPLS